MSGLVPCPACSRHVRRKENACPFCGAAVTEAIARTPERAMPTARLGRSALFAFAAASVGAASCGGEVNAETSKTRVTEDAAANGGSSNAGGEIGIQSYGAPFPPEVMTGAGGAGGAGAGGQLGIVLYGGPFPTGGITGAGGETGGTKSTDAGNEDAAAGGAGGTFGAPHYGGPPQK